MTDILSRIDDTGSLTLTLDNSSAKFVPSGRPIAWEFTVIRGEPADRLWHALRKSEAEWLAKRARLRRMHHLYRSRRRKW